MTRRKAIGLGAVLLGTLFFASACSEHQDPMAPPDDTGEVVVIEIRNFEFSRPNLTIDVGTTVRWTNTTSTFHTVTPDGHTRWTEWQTAGMGQSFEVRFDQAGTFPYYCAPHQALGMTGRVIVQ